MCTCDGSPRRVEVRPSSHDDPCSRFGRLSAWNGIVQMTFSKRRSVWILGVSVFAVVLLAITPPLPDHWPSGDHARAIAGAYAAVILMSRSSNVPVTAATYAVVIHDRSRHEVAVSFLPRDYVRYAVSGQSPETVTAIVRRGSSRVLRVYFEAD